ncbi:kinase-like protein [Calocera cornea HHB12733]|uniref:Kinase-like protein n=1 Tax=Calocera cornea HHB12733 TaxID=1353952 RepID=A0A165CHA6_9BASI|nr:kinase-like protein [Calocera cornea HHB12733]
MDDPGPSYSTQDIPATPSSQAVDTVLAPALLEFATRPTSLALAAQAIPEVLTLKDLTAGIENISGNPVGGGARGNVWTALYIKEKVALKTIRASGRKWEKHFVRELRAWTGLSHPNLLPLYGVCTHGLSGLAMVSPWMDFGRILDYLNDHKEARRDPLILGIAKGLCYLHTLEDPIAHGDLRAANVLVNAEHEACLADFGLARFVFTSQDTSESESGTQGNERWMPPERFSDTEMTSATSVTTVADVYAFGMVIYEIYTGLKPFHHVRNHFIVVRMVSAGDIMQRPTLEGTDTELWDGMWALAEDCWKKEPHARPTAEELVARVGVMVRDAVDQSLPPTKPQ